MENTQNKSAAVFNITCDWAVQSKALKQQFPELTDADLKFEIGKMDDMLGRIETRLNKKRDEVIAIISKGQPQKV